MTDDAVCGCDYRFRQSVESQGLGYVVEVRADFAVCVGFRQVRVRALLDEVPATAWHRLGCGVGSKGPRLYDFYDWAVASTNCPEPERYAR